MNTQYSNRSTMHFYSIEYTILYITMNTYTMLNTLKNKQCFNSNEDTISNYKEYKMFNTSMHTQCLQWRIYIVKFPTRIPAPLGSISFIFIQFPAKKSIIRPGFFTKKITDIVSAPILCLHTHSWVKLL